MNEAVNFYTGILDYELEYPDAVLNEFCLDLINGEAELQPTMNEHAKY